MFATAIHFHPSPIFVGKGGAWQSGPPYGEPIQWYAPNLACKYQTMVEVKCIGKHSSLLRYGNNYGSKKFYSTDPRREKNSKKVLPSAPNDFPLLLNRCLRH